MSRALTLPLAASACETKWNWSAVPQMSLPPPWIVQVRPLRDWLPAGYGYPISPQLQPPVQIVGCGGAVGLQLGGSKVDVLIVPVRWVVTANRANVGLFRVRVK